jgi:hypothetical protein
LARCSSIPSVVARVMLVQLGASPSAHASYVFRMFVKCQYGIIPEKAGRSKSVVGVTVRREKALDFGGCNSRPGTGFAPPDVRLTMKQRVPMLGNLPRCLLNQDGLWKKTKYRPSTELTLQRPSPL